MFFLNVQNVGKDFVFMEMFDAVKIFLKTPCSLNPPPF